MAMLRGSTVSLGFSTSGLQKPLWPCYIGLGPIFPDLFWEIGASQMSGRRGFLGPNRWYPKTQALRGEAAAEAAGDLDQGEVGPGDEPLFLGEPGHHVLTCALLGCFKEKPTNGGVVFEVTLFGWV